MPTCPKCKKEINSLTTADRELHWYEWTLKDGELDTRETDQDTLENAIDGYLCPECDARVCMDEDDAEAFLKGEELEDE